MKTIITFLITLATLFSYSQTVLYITQTGAGLKDGSSWANAGDSSMVQSFINMSSSGTDIWIAAGTYKPNSYPAGCSNCISHRDYSFVLKNGVSIYGSFSGNETSTAQRNLNNLTTVFDGDLDSIGYLYDNCYHLVLGLKTSRTASLDGLIIKNGVATGSGNTTISSKNILRDSGGGVYSDSANLNIQNCLITENTCNNSGAGIISLSSHSIFSNTVFSHNRNEGFSGDGGGLCTDGQFSYDTIINCIFSVNYSNHSGGGVYSGLGHVYFERTVFSYNSTDGSGGASFNYYDTARFVNCVFYRNSASYKGAAMLNRFSSVRIQNSTLSSDYTDTAGAEGIRNEHSRLYLDYSVMWGYTGYAYTSDGSSNVFPSGSTIQGLMGSNTNPLLKNMLNGTGPDNIWKTADDGLRPQCNSPLNNLAAFGAPLTDISGFARIGYAEPGAYEIIDTFYHTPLIAANPTAICPGDTVTFSLINVPGDASAIITWKKNQLAIANGFICKVVNLTNSDSVFCSVTSSDTCSSGTFVSNSIKVSVAATSTPPVTISASQNPVCVNTPVTFMASSLFGGSHPFYQWKKNGNAVGTDSIAYSNSGLINGDIITCELISDMACFTNSAGVSNSITMIVNNPAPPVITISTNNTHVCALSTIAFNSNTTLGGNNPQYQWFRNDTAVGNGINYSVTGLHTGDFIYCILTSNAACTTTNIDTSNYLTMTVDSPFATSVTIVADKPGLCVGESITFTATPTNGGAPSYLWKKNGINTGFAGNPYTTTNLSNNDQITAQMTSSLSCVTQQTVISAPINITIYPTPSSSITVGGSLALCQGQSVTLSAGTGNSYLWSTGATSSSINVTQAGTYTVTVTSQHNCTAVSAPKTVTVTPMVTPSVTVNASSTVVCPGAQITFTAVTTDAGSPTYTWYKNGTIIVSRVNPFITTNLVNNDQITVKIVSTLNCVTQQTVTSAPITVTNVPTPSITQSGNVLTSNVTNGNQWYFNGNLVSGANGQNYTPTQTGNYTVIVTINGCSSQQSNSIFVSVTGMEEITAESITVYPNPATNELTINLNSLQAEQVFIYNVDGKLVSETKQPANNLIDISNLAAGVYIAEIKVRDAIPRVRWVKM